jgi:hypothetical protein
MSEAPVDPGHIVKVHHSSLPEPDYVKPTLPVGKQMMFGQANPVHTAMMEQHKSAEISRGRGAVAPSRPSQKPLGKAPVNLTPGS